MATRQIETLTLAGAKVALEAAEKKAKEIGIISLHLLAFFYCYTEKGGPNLLICKRPNYFYL
jgi:hypothetical protein